MYNLHELLKVRKKYVEIFEVKVGIKTSKKKFNSTEFNTELLTKEYTMQKHIAIKLGQKVGQSTYIFIDEYRFNRILKNVYSEFRMQGAF